MRLATILILTLLTLTSFGQDKDSVQSYIFVTEPVPSYPGGYAQMNNFIKHNLARPRGSRKIKGAVYVEFNVNVDGSLSDFRVVKGLMKSFDDSALRTVMMMPDWLPAKKDDKPVKTKMVIQIKFD